MTGKQLKAAFEHIPDDAVIVQLCDKYVGWRCANGKLKCYSFLSKSQ